MAVSTATQLSNPRISWVANLGAIIGGGAYSSFKSREIAYSIASNLAEVSALSKRLLLDEYKLSVLDENPQFVAALIKTFNTSEFNKVDDVVIEVDSLEELSKCMKEKIEGCTAMASSSKWYVWPNVTIQSVLTLLAGTFNAIANIGFEGRAEEEKKYSDYSDWRNVLNYSLVPFCIITQCGTHMFVAGRLRKIEAHVNDFKKRLLKIQNSLSFRLLELSVKLCDVDSKINECNSSIKEARDQLSECQTERDSVGRSLREVQKTITTCHILYTRLHFTIFKHDDLVIIDNGRLIDEIKLQRIFEKCKPPVSDAQRDEIMRAAREYLEANKRRAELTDEILALDTTLKTIGDRISSQEGVLTGLVAKKQKIDSGLAKAKKQAIMASEISVMHVDAAVPAGAAAEEKADAGESEPDAGPRLLPLLRSAEPSRAVTTESLVMV